MELMRFVLCGRSIYILNLNVKSMLLHRICERRNKNHPIDLGQISQSTYVETEGLSDTGAHVK